NTIHERHSQAAEGRRRIQIPTFGISGQQPVRGYLGNQGRNRPNKGPRHNRDGNRGNNGGRPDEMMHEPEVFDADDSEIISPAELTQSRSSMSPTKRTAKPTHQL